MVELKSLDTAGILLILFFNILLIICASVYFLSSKQWNADSMAEFDQMQSKFQETRTD